MLRTCLVYLPLLFMIHFTGLAGIANCQSISKSSVPGLGHIDFPTSFSGEAQQEFIKGVLALHSFWYPQARDHFREAQKREPSFAMAYWGEAMTYNHPIWGQHYQNDGEEVLEKMDAQSDLRWSEREKRYVEAVKILFDDSQSMRNRKREYASAMKVITEEYPEDSEAEAFLALAEMTMPGYRIMNPNTADFNRISERLENLYEENPEHPGVIHYLIHVYDSRTHAQKGLEAAKSYEKVAYSSSHAVHMPSHIYKHLRMWDEVIASNIKAWEVSAEWQEATKRPLSSRDFHAYGWLFDAYMRTDQYKEACDMVLELASLEKKGEELGENINRISRTKSNYLRRIDRGAPDSFVCRDE